MKGHDWFSTFIPSEDRSALDALFLQARAGIQTRGNVSPVLTKDGRLRQIEWYDKTLKDAKGSTVGLLCIGQDVTARKQAEEELRRYSEDLALLNRLDAAINRGESLDATVALLAAETRKSFGGRGATLFLLSEDRQKLELSNMGLSGSEIRKVEKMLGGRDTQSPSRAETGRVSCYLCWRPARLGFCLMRRRLSAGPGR